ncbi:hypothetical protein AB0I55_23265 [Actinocatenispora sera]|uniref:hypothetical protein n=1 Tax=Actinocatenispora sera TaxID=390989 RepID=UPI0033C63AD8
MDLASSIGIGLIGIVLGVAGRMLGPRPTAPQAFGCAVAGVVGGELGVLLGSRASRGEFQWIGGIVLAALFVAAAVAWFVLRRAPYPPHDNTPRRIDPDDVEAQLAERSRSGTPDRHDVARDHEVNDDAHGNTGASCRPDGSR